MFFSMRRCVETDKLVVRNLGSGGKSVKRINLTYTQGSKLSEGRPVGNPASQLAVPLVNPISEMTQQRH
jgi:hypothetical protein